MNSQLKYRLKAFNDEKIIPFLPCKEGIFFHQICTLCTVQYTYCVFKQVLAARFMHLEAGVGLAKEQIVYKKRLLPYHRTQAQIGNRVQH